MNKNKNKLKLLLLVFVVLFISGCVSRLEDTDGNVVVEPNSGQTLTENILCRPTDPSIIKIYEENDIDLEELPSCKNFTPASGGYEGIWTSIFVKPVAFLIIFIGERVGNYGLAIILATLVIRFVMSPITKKSADQSEKMKKARPDLDEIEKKYKSKTSNDRDVMLQKSQETMAIYKKHGISPASGCIFSFIQIPLFFANYQALMRIPVIYEESFLGLNLGTNPSTAFSNGQYYYIITLVLLLITTYFSFKLTGSSAASKEQEKQMQFMMKIMIVFILFAAFTFPTALAVYWITNSSFTIYQNIMSKRRISNDKKI